MNRRRACSKHHRGFNLLDVVLSIAIFSIGVMAYAQFQANLSRAGMDARLRTMASNIAEETIETQRRFLRLEIDPGGTEPSYEDIKDETLTQQRGGINFTTVQTVTDYYWNKSTGSFSTTPPSGQVHSDFKRIDLTVSWENPLEFRIDENQTTSGHLGSGSIDMSAVVSSAVTTTAQLALLKDLDFQSLHLPLSGLPLLNDESQTGDEPDDDLDVPILGGLFGD